MVLWTVSPVGRARIFKGCHAVSRYKHPQAGVSAPSGF